MPGGTLPVLGNILMAQALQASLTPAASITAATSSTSTYTIQGLVQGDIVIVEPQAAIADPLTMGSVWVSAANTLKVQWVNPSASTGPASPAALTCIVFVCRPERVAFGVAQYPTQIN
jgi:hypothetical protein